MGSRKADRSSLEVEAEGRRTRRTPVEEGLQLGDEMEKMAGEGDADLRCGWFSALHIRLEELIPCRGATKVCTSEPSSFTWRTRLTDSLHRRA